ncbi:MAG: hypothetical protein WCT08_00465 [Patescibacteria group bacterium]|jgi:hypothetical protein
MADNVSDLGLRLNYWFLTNRQQLRKWWVILLLALDIFILAVCITQGLLMIIRFHDSSNTLSSIVETTKQNGQAQSAFKPKNLVQATAFTTLHGLGRYDFSARLENPNDYWLATATVQFGGGKNKLTPVQVILPPKSIRYAMALDIEPATENEVPKASYSVTNINWEKLDAAEVAKNIIDLKVEKLKQSQTSLISREGTNRVVTQVNGEVSNKSFFKLDGLRIAIVLSNGTETIGVRSAIISSIAAETTLPFSVEWDTALPSAQKVEAFPEIHSRLIKP